jgi:ureidoacrylate peracid hydrolase
MPGFEPLPGELVFPKNRYSGFIGTNLELVLRSTGKKTIICAGTATNVCVESTARHGYMLDFNLVMLNDGTATYDDTLHEATLTTISKHFGKVVSVEDVIDCWKRGGHLPAEEAALAGAGQSRG